METCDCIDSQWPPEELLVKYQYISDVLIALAYFSIPLELIYFVQKSAFFPYRWVLMQFGAFIILCGATHFINLWTFTMHSKVVAMVMTIAKVACAIVSCATALMLVHIIPDLLSVKTRELFLRNKAEELDREMGLILTQEETGRTLGLEECALWMPSRTVFNSARAMRIPYTCPLARIRPLVGRYVPPEVVAVRVPLLHLSNFQINDWPELSAKSYAVMVLILPTESARKWRDHELELVEVVADQVAVALSHAAILEESMRARDQLLDQNVALNLARQEAEKAIHARNDFLSVMNHEMRTPMHAIIALCSLLLETELTPEQRVMIETVLKSSNLLATLINDVLDLSRLEDGSLELDFGMFDLHGIFKEVINLIKPIASIKKLSMTMILAPDLPMYAVGDEKRLMQTILNIVGNAVKFTKEGYVSIIASVAKPESLRDWRPPELYPVSSQGHFYLRVQVKDSGCGVLPQDIPILFTKFAQQRSGSSQNSGGAGLGLAICKRFVNLMGGHIWLESEGVNKGSTATFLIRLGICNNPNDALIHPQVSSRVRAYHGSADLSGQKPILRENDGGVSANARYQRSL
ncbi:hypothetical protein V6Z12_A12G148800 [Gossypium hirsutum]